MRRLRRARTEPLGIGIDALEYGAQPIRRSGIDPEAIDALTDRALVRCTAADMAETDAARCTLLLRNRGQAWGAVRNCNRLRKARLARDLGEGLRYRRGGRCRVNHPRQPAIEPAGVTERLVASARMSGVGICTSPSSSMRERKSEIHHASWTVTVSGILLSRTASTALAVSCCTQWA